MTFRQVADGQSVDTNTGELFDEVRPEGLATGEAPTAPLPLVPVYQCTTEEMDPQGDLFGFSSPFPVRFPAWWREPRSPQERRARGGYLNRMNELAAALQKKEGECGAAEFLTELVKGCDLLTCDLAWVVARGRALAERVGEQRKGAPQ